mmetsp:Transcript_7877/g.27357  ORF Transcript_7877/g.27357 Transcript_7877/m.27357 type:complete len:210 (-) Transcript_7877:1109-1738(-)
MGLGVRFFELHRELLAQPPQMRLAGQLERVQRHLRLDEVEAKLLGVWRRVDGLRLWANGFVHAAAKQLLRPRCKVLRQRGQVLGAARECRTQRVQCVAVFAEGKVARGARGREGLVHAVRQPVQRVRRQHLVSRHEDGCRRAAVARGQRAHGAPPRRVKGVVGGRRRRHVVQRRRRRALGRLVGFQGGVDLAGDVSRRVKLLGLVQGLF